METWKDVVGYEGIYQVSDHGNVRRVAYFDNASEAHHGNMLFKKMKQTTSNIGYKRIKLMKDGKPKIELVHRLVAKAFIPNPKDKPCVNHIDGKKWRNHFSNLEWCTYSENQRHADALGLRVMRNKKGSKPVGMFEKTTKRLLKTFPSCNEASRQTGFAQTHIGDCCNGKLKTAYGYVWKYL